MTTLLARPAGWKMIGLLGCLALLAAAHASGQEQEPQGVAGFWAGELDAGGTRLLLVFEITASEEGTLAGRMFSPDQMEEAIPVESVTLEDGRLTVNVPAIGGQYRAALGENGREAMGEWKQGGITFPVRLTRQKSMPKKEHIETWQGTLRAMGKEFDFQLRVFSDQARGMTAVLDSFSENAKGLPVRLERNGDQFRFEMLAIKARYEGLLAEGGTRIEGKWKQSGQEFPLEFRKLELQQTRDLQARRPQTPQKPYPWREVELSVEHPGREGGPVTLAGTLALPKDVSRPPVAILISGSGQQDRNCTIFDHQLFLVMTAHLTAHGIATLRYDDRGVGGSTGDLEHATSEDFAADAGAWVEAMRSNAEVDGDRIILIGHSEGGLIAPIVAGKEPVRLVVLLAGPAVSGRDIILSQTARIAAATGLDEEGLKQQRQAMRRILEMAMTGDSANETDSSLLEAFAEELDPDEDDSAELLRLRAALATFRGAWMRYFLAYDPVPRLRELRVPVLALFAEKDMQVLPELNEAPMREALAAAPSGDVEVAVLSGLNHLFQTAPTGAPAEYAAIEESMAPALLDRITGWITQRLDGAGK